jgi:uncharacterized protein YoxC
MIPTWAAVVGALSLAVIALAAITSALAILLVAFGIRSFVKAMQDTTLPVVADVRHLVASIRTEVDGIAESSRDIRQRLVRAADGAEARLADIAAAVRTVKDGVALWKLARAPRSRRPKRRKS